jgi:signal transduction histidine kinase
MKKYTQLSGTRWLGLWLMFKHQYKSSGKNPFSLQQPSEQHQPDDEGSLLAFLHHTSHELKGPISRLKGLLELSEMDGELQRGEYSQRIGREVKQMESMLGKLEIINQIRNSEHQTENCRLEDLLNDVLHRLQEQIINRNIYIRIYADEDIRLETVPFLLSEMLYNLLENAVLHSSQSGQPYIDLNLKKSGKRVEIDIEDNGSGIPEKAQSQIFQLFYRASHCSQGGGIGLYIVKEAARLLNAEINFTSREGCYSRFHLYLPLHHKLAAQHPGGADKLAQ